jgi:multicomponent Na+:H+ antiporter subunit E
MARIVYFIIGYAFWLLLTFSLDWQHLVAGVVVSGLTAMVFGKISIVRGSKFLQPQRYFWMLIYVLVLLWECLKANVDVAYRVLHPAMPIRPGIVRVQTSLKTDVARTCLANSITMTPGTLTVDIDGTGHLFIHWIHIKQNSTGRAKEMIVNRFERILKRVFE